MDNVANTTFTIEELEEHDNKVRLSTIDELVQEIVKPGIGVLNCDDKCGDPTCPDDMRIEFLAEVVSWLQQQKTPPTVIDLSHLSPEEAKQYLQDFFASERVKPRTSPVINRGFMIE